jgi:hypothetical protein
MPIVSRGDRELSLRFDTFPTRAHKRLEDKISALTEQLQARVEAASPVLTGLLRSEITPRDFADNVNRVAGYVSVFAHSSNEYAKAATLEYGSSKPRREFQRTSSGILSRFGLRQQRIVARISKPVDIKAFRYLRGPLEQMRPEIEAGLNEALAEAAAEE